LDELVSPARLLAAAAIAGYRVSHSRAIKTTNIDVRKSAGNSQRKPIVSDLLRCPISEDIGEAP
jgi:hypothetical protein